MASNNALSKLVGLQKTKQLDKLTGAVSSPTTIVSPSASTKTTGNTIEKEDTGAYSRYLQSQNSGSTNTTTTKPGKSNYEGLSTQDAIDEKLAGKKLDTTTTEVPTTDTYNFTPSQTYLKAMEYTNQLLAQLNSGRTSYTDKLNDIMAQIDNRDKFSYDFNNDPLFQQSLESAMQSGKLAMQDTMGQASALTGGYGSSYGTAVANQAYNASVQGAYDNLTDFAGLAYDQYQNETNNLYNQLAMYQSADETEYNRMANAYSANATAAANLYDQEYNNYWQNRKYADSLASATAESETPSYLGTTEFNALKNELEDAMKNHPADSTTINEMLATYANKYGWTSDSAELQQLINYVEGLQGQTQYSLTVAPNGNPMYKDQYGKPYQGSQSSIKFTLSSVGKNGKSTDNDAVYTDGKGNTLTYAEILGKGWESYITSKKVQ